MEADDGKPLKCSFLALISIANYVYKQPRGILFGRMVLELGDMCAVKCEQTNMVCDVDFKTKVCPGFDPPFVYQSLQNGVGTGTGGQAGLMEIRREPHQGPVSSTFRTVPLLLWEMFAPFIELTHLHDPP
jgi:hypothetical protein